MIIDIQEKELEFVRPILKGAFETVCEDMDAYHCAVRDGIGANYVERCLGDGETFQDEAEQAKQRAFDLVQRFVDIRTKEREQGSNITR